MSAIPHIIAIDSATLAESIRALRSIRTANTSQNLQRLNAITTRRRTGELTPGRAFAEIETITRALPNPLALFLIGE